MKKTILKFLLPVAMVSGFSLSSHASLLLEPYIGYEMGKTSATTAILGVDASGKPTMTDLGLRIGYHLPILFWFGLDATMGTGKFNPDSSSATNSEFTRSTFAAVAGVDFPILVRAWLGYGFSNKFTNKDTSKDYTGTNTKIGVGFTGLPFLSVNLEVITDTIDKYDGNDIKNTYSKFDNTSYLLSVSLPLSL